MNTPTPNQNTPGLNVKSGVKAGPLILLLRS